MNPAEIRYIKSAIESIDALTDGDTFDDVSDYVYACAKANELAKELIEFISERQ